MQNPLVAIVGRPNVGKSSLFNRLTKNKTAIVDDISGVTRDRNYGEVDWNGKIFELIDTGGYVPNSEDVFEAAIREQVQIAIDEADLILFVVDGRTGLTPFDENITKLLRVSSKPIIVVVNKIDNSNQSLLITDFYKIGLKSVFDISALSGRNTGDLLDEIIRSMKFPEQGAFEDNRLRISIIGRPNVGKSSLTNALLGIDRSIVTDVPGTTRDSLNSVLKYYGEEIIMVDTAGLRKKAKVNENVEFYSNIRTYKAIADSDVAIVLLDAQFGLEKQDQKILDEAVSRRKGIILAINKWDLVEKDTNTSKYYENEIKRNLGSLDYIPIIFISALTKQRIFKLVELAKQIAEERKKKIPTSVLNETLLEEIAKTPPASTPNGKEIKIKYITQVGEKYPIFFFFANDVKYIQDSYRRFLEKLIRRNFGFKGVAITITFKDKNPKND
ncbi:MAG: ribosome biogenesis GTPase Der [Ignavibacteriales bacterium CG_4_9_14_3_um_filter_34_10]|nr:MAG: ribosome biogenesis GTPase Der [Ignavibacteriales bacterium CG_4_9_14_3_um_filter_34_10]